MRQISEITAILVMAKRSTEKPTNVTPRNLKLHATENAKFSNTLISFNALYIIYIEFKYFSINIFFKNTVNNLDFEC